MKEMVKIFAKEIEKMLDEKFDKYQNSWKEEDLNSLGDKLQAQFSNFILRNHLKKDPKRTITHAGVYCMFILNKLNKLNK